MKRAISFVAAFFFFVFPSMALAQFTYEAIDLGPLGPTVGIPSSLALGQSTPDRVYSEGFLQPCWVSSCNGINNSGDYICNLEVNQGGTQSFSLMINQQQMGAPSIGCSISDDPAILGSDSLGAAIWYAGPTGSFVPFPLTWHRPASPWSRYFGVPESAFFFQGGTADVAGVGTFQDGGGTFSGFFGTVEPDILTYFPIGTTWVIPTAVRQMGPDSFILAGSYGNYLTSGGKPLPFRIDYNTNGQVNFIDLGTFGETSGTVHTITPSGILAGCARQRADWWWPIQSFVSGDRFSGNPSEISNVHPSDSPGTSSCLFNGNSFDFLVGSYGARFGYIWSPYSGATDINSSIVEDGRFFDDQMDGMTWQIVDLRDINDRGEMIGNAWVSDPASNGQYRGILLRPVITPVSIEIQAPYRTIGGMSGAVLQTSNSTRNYIAYVYLSDIAPGDGWHYSGIGAVLYSTDDSLAYPLYTVRDIHSGQDYLKFDVSVPPSAGPFPKAGKLGVELAGVRREAAFIVVGPEICDDETDNNGDGLVDCADEYGCDFEVCAPGALCRSLTCSEDDCSDHVDNDSDGNVDCADIDCEGRRCAEGRFCSNGACISNETICYDRVDNNGNRNESTFLRQRPSTFSKRPPVCEPAC